MNYYENNEEFNKAFKETILPMTLCLHDHNPKEILESFNRFLDEHVKSGHISEENTHLYSFLNLDTPDIKEANTRAAKSTTRLSELFDTLEA